MENILERCNEIDRSLDKIERQIHRGIKQYEYEEKMEDFRKIEKLLQEKLDDMHEIWRLKDEISRLQNILIDNNIKFR
ncbi:hypothetical protein [Clostridium sp. KNHs214]|uniref:hypothetical protein n=1 Tax=Clostridium sp. KNHs214 TaxID=1540257 RepID=UPI0005553BF7|nr:hypothetical protein [Clostridium sp. KNHs214]